MVNTQLFVTLDGPGVGEFGVPIDDLAHALAGLQDAIRLMVEHLGGRRPGPGQPPKWVRDQSRLLLTATRRSSLVAELTLGPSSSDQIPMENLGQRALETLLNWDGREDSSLPEAVEDKIRGMAASLSRDTRIWLGTADDYRKVEIHGRDFVSRSRPGTEEALLHGWLKEVNWNNGTAQLHYYSGSYVRLRFDVEFAQNMIRLATKYVEVRGRGTLNKEGDWTSVQVKHIDGTRSWKEPFDLEAFWNNPNPKVFDPEKVVRASEPFDVDEFIRFIHEGRDI